MEDSTFDRPEIQNLLIIIKRLNELDDSFLYDDKNVKNITKESLTNELKKIASDKKTSTEVLNLLSETKDSEILLSLAENENITTAIFNKLARHNNQKIRKAIAMNSSIPWNIYNFLLKDKKKSVQIGIMLNPKTTVEVLTSFLNSKHIFVRETAKEQLIIKAKENYENGK